MMVAGAAVLAILAGGAAAQDKKDKGGLQVGDPVKELKLKTLDGKEINIQNLKKGQILVLNFWGAF
jgi:hypothetical protein